MNTTQPAEYRASRRPAKLGRFSLYASLALVGLGPIGQAAAQTDTADVSDTAASQAAQSVSELLDQASAERREQRWLPALALYERALIVAPGNDTAFRERTITLQLQGSSGLAWRYYQQRPDLFNADEASGLRQDYIARRAVWGNLPDAQPDPMAGDMPLALQQQNAFLAELPQDATPLRQRLDRLYILHGLRRHEEVVTEYQRLLADDIEIPVYALQIVGDSLLQTRRPQQAVAVLEQVVDAGAATPDDHITLAYAYLEAGRWREALSHLETEAQKERAWLWVGNAKQPAANWNRFFLDTTLAMVRGYSGDLAGAQQTLETMNSLAPRNAGLYNNLASVYLQRGWESQALASAQRATELDPRSLDAKAGQADALIAGHRIGEARAIADDLRERDATLPRVERLQRDLRAATGWSVTATAFVGDSDTPGGELSPTGSREERYVLEAWSPLLNNRWRVGALGYEHSSDFREVTVQDTRGGIGVSYAHDRLSAELRVERSDDEYSRDTSWLTEVAWRASDTVDVSALHATHSREGSLQARFFGITADQSQVAVSWEPDEKRAYRAAVNVMDYTDGNHQESLSLGGRQRLIDNPDAAVDVSLGLYAGQASDQDTAYYNPEESASWEVGVQWEDRTWSRYERRFSQLFRASGGQSWQKGFGSDAIPALGYRHRWGIAPGRDLEYGVSWSRPVYDGTRETHLTFDIGITWGQ
ncbi:poly-beta-1,6 N-acetyl-D-glucosamine export porin PgaA [Halomonas sp. V046]|uniref:poly-beta-1,6 N-acetyl-D-glucosamine export porin PgaA n=1 Tax=Halomonas sp. V046 TaxID=3459611 RepID=UPI0040440AB0